MRRDRDLPSGPARIYLERRVTRRRWGAVQCERGDNDHSKRAAAAQRLHQK